MYQIEQNDSQPAKSEQEPLKTWPQPGNSLPTGAPEPRRAKKAADRGHHHLLFPVLLTALITFTASAGLFYVLLINNVLPFGNSVAQNSSGLSIGVADTDADTQAEAQKLATEIQLIKDNFYRELSDQEILAAINQGLPDSLGDPYTYYLSADDYQAMKESISGQYSGIGATVSPDSDGTLEVIEVQEGGPAYEAGVMAGDIPVEVDGESVEDLDSASELANKIKGEAGTDVTVKFYRPSTEEYLTITMTRQDITTEVVSYRMLDEDTGYLKISSFTANLFDQFKAGVDSLTEDGATEMVIDLRNNLGGDAQAVIDCLDYLLPEGEVARINGRSDGQAYTQEWTSDASMGVSEDLHYAILMNSNTASASELFSGCLRDWNKAVLVGEQSYGKGSGTTTIQLSDGSAVNVTIFRYVLPGGEEIEGTGLTPDYPVSLSDEASQLPLSQLPEAEDSQLQQAIEALQLQDAAGTDSQTAG
ncbi:MAG: S41 family peptidase [Oscillospiraceae bacterium]|nr:S41 family peptidase [Oscillospiraceae bacterium]MDD4367788.1 S41 family peptidase [Oscillospiraceae bacterium]